MGADADSRPSPPRVSPRRPTTYAPTIVRCGHSSLTSPIPFPCPTRLQDLFDPAAYSKGPRSNREKGYASNRYLTAIFYLNTPAKGGETGFPRAGRLPQPRDFLDCSVGLAVKPEKGALAIFYSMLPSGEFDYTSLHAGCDVLEGEKWASNYWMWSSRQQGSRHAQALAAELEQFHDGRGPPVKALGDADGPNGE